MPPKGSKKAKPPLPIPGSATYPGKPDGKGLEAPQWEACRRILEGVYLTKEDNVNIAEIFCELPDREDFADYYETIPEPECLNNVATMLSDQAFPTPDKFFAQLLLIFLNAKHYNEDGSVLFEDATAFEEQIWEAWRKYAADGIFKPQPHLPKTQARKGKQTLVVNPVARVTSTTPIPAGSPAPAPAPPPAQALPKPILIAPSAVASSSRASRSAPVPPPTPQTPNHPPPRGLSNADQITVAAVDARMARWSGPMAMLPGSADQGGISGSGWWGDDQLSYEASPAGRQNVGIRIKGVLAAVCGYRDEAHVLLATTLESVPSAINLPYLSYTHPISLASIRNRSDKGEYKNLLEFDIDMARIFERGRRWYYEGTTEYGHILTLQRLYNALTSLSPIPSHPTPGPSKTNFASIVAGPGRARPTSESEGSLSITTQKVGTKDRTFIPEARHKGVAYKVGDYVHVINPDDATRPIVGQVFKAFVPTKGAKKHHVTVCWYFRPEQTVHTAKSQFLDREVLKTGHMCDHPVDDLIEKISLQFFVKYVRGRSRSGEYYPGWPLYVCVSRFNDKAWATIKIKNWASCIPEELRHSEFMSFVPFDRQLDPYLFPSPLLSDVKGPGHLAEPRGQVTEDDDEEKVSTPTARPTPQSAPSTRQATQPQSITPAPATGVPAIPHRPQSAPAPYANRTFGAMYGGQQAMDQIAYKDYLPVETARLFDRDARQAVLWFSGAPLPSTHESQRPVHSLAYLEHLAKRKRADETEAARKKSQV